MKLNKDLKPIDKWEKRKECMKALNALYIAIPEQVAADVKRKVMEALEEEYDRGYEEASYHLKDEE